MTQHVNTVELIDTYGGDLTHALSAWTSTARDLDTPERDGKTKRSRVGALLKMLSEDGHHTPFEKSTLHFLMTTEIASHIHLLKHRIGVSVNSESARYKELTDKFAIPVDWPAEEQALLTVRCEDAWREYHALIERLVAKGLSRKRAKESARFVLPYAMQYTVDVTMNFRSFAHFIVLRYAKTAQYEIRALAAEMLMQVWEKGTFDETLKAFGFIAPCLDHDAPTNLRQRQAKDGSWWEMRKPFGKLRVVEL